MDAVLQYRLDDNLAVIRAQLALVVALGGPQVVTALLIVFQFDICEICVTILCLIKLLECLFLQRILLIASPSPSRALSGAG